MMIDLRFPRRFVLFGAVCALITVITTLAVHLLPALWAEANTFELQVELRNNPVYVARLWVVLAHCWLVVISMLAAGGILFRARPHLAVLGFTGFLVFAFTELLRTSLVIFGLNRTWRAAYAAAESDAARELARNTITAFLGVNDALFFVFFIAFNLGVFCYGLALLRLDIWSRRLGYIYILWSLLSIPGVVDEATGATHLANLTSWVGPYFQPVARLLTAVWLWNKASESSPSTTN